MVYILEGTTLYESANGVRKKVGPFTLTEGERSPRLTIVDALAGR